MALPHVTDYLGYSGLDAILLVSFVCLLYTSISHLTLWSYLLFGVVYATYRMLRKLRDAERVDPQEKYVLITGCDTGIGFGLAKLLDRKGFHVFAACLDDTCDGAKELKTIGSKRMRVLQLDVTSDESVQKNLEKVNQHCPNNGLWALVNNAGTSLAGDVEVQPMSNFRLYAEINLFGLIRVTKTFLPLVRRRRGRVVNVTSLRGRLAFPTSAPYCMSKFGAEGFSDSLRLEMKRFGVKVVIVEPGNYGLWVGQYSEKNREKMRVQYQSMIDSVEPEIRDVYGQEYLQTFVNDLPTAHPYTDAGIRGVLKALESAVAGRHPRSRYLADSSNLLIDGNCMMVRLRDYLPESVMDRIMMFMRPLPREAYYATSHVSKRTD